MRADFAGEDCECDHRIDELHDDGCSAEEDATPEGGCAPSDVFIVESEQERWRGFPNVTVAMNGTILSVALTHDGAPMTTTVSELLDLLESCDPGAGVRIMQQEGWPFENAIRALLIARTRTYAKFG